MISFCKCFLISLMLLIPAISIADETENYEQQYMNNWPEVPDSELAKMRGGFFTNIGGIGINLGWQYLIDVNDQRVLTHDVTSDFVGKVVNIDSLGSIQVSDFQTLALALQNSSDNLRIQAQQILDLQLTNISSYQNRLFADRLNDSLLNSLPSLN